MLGQTDPDGLFRRQNKLRTGISVAIISPHMEYILQPWMRNAVVSGKGYQLGGAVGWQAVEPALCRRNTGAIDHDSGSDIRRQGRKQVSDGNERRNGVSGSVVRKKAAGNANAIVRISPPQSGNKGSIVDWTAFKTSCPLPSAVRPIAGKTSCSAVSMMAAGMAASRPRAPPEASSHRFS